MPTQPEDLARNTIDSQLSAAGWCLQDFAQLNLLAGRRVAVREMRSQGGPADSILNVDAVGVTGSDKTDSRPPIAPFDKLLRKIALGERNEVTLTDVPLNILHLAA